MGNTANMTYREMSRDEALLILQDTRRKHINSLQIQRKTAAGRSGIICSPQSLEKHGDGTCIWYRELC